MVTCKTDYFVREVSMATRKTGEFTVVDENGKRYKIIKYTDFEDAPVYQTGNQTVQGFDSFRLATGETLNKISDTEFVTVVSGIKLKPE
jgi:hypothetical protein